MGPLGYIRNWCAPSFSDTWKFQWDNLKSEGSVRRWNWMLCGIVFPVYLSICRVWRGLFLSSCFYKYIQYRVPNCGELLVKPVDRIHLFNCITSMQWIKNWSKFIFKKMGLKVFAESLPWDRELLNEVYFLVELQFCVRTQGCRCYYSAWHSCWCHYRFFHNFYQRLELRPV